MTQTYTTTNSLRILITVASKRKHKEIKTYRRGILQAVYLLWRSEQRQRRAPKKTVTHIQTEKSMVKRRPRLEQSIDLNLNPSELSSRVFRMDFDHLNLFLVYFSALGRFPSFVWDYACSTFFLEKISSQKRLFPR